jgi:Cu(I)/Ag(I) efflux system membrane fusion protein
MQMELKHIAKIVGGLILTVALVALGYVWGSKTKDQGLVSTQKSMSSDMANMKGMEGMSGMEMPPGTAIVSPEKQQLLGVRITTVEARPLSKTVRTVGTITYDETKVSHVHSKVEGWIEKLYADYTGKFVQKGQPLFTIYSPDLLATQGEYLLAIKSYERLANSSIPEVKAGAESLVHASKQRLALWDISDQQISDLERKREPQKTLTFYAPHSGFIIKKDINQGMRIMPDKELYTIADLSTIWVDADVYESEISLIKVGQQATINLSYYPEDTFRGRISYIYPYLNEKTRTLKVRLEFPNSALKLKPDMYVNVEIKIDSGRHLAVPEEAVLDTGIRKVIFVDKGNGHFEPKEVKLGNKLDGFYQVLSGLQEGERIASSSVFLLDSESRLSEAMGAMAGMPGMSMAGMQGMEGMKMDVPTKGGPQEKKIQDLTLTFSTRPEKAKAGENVLRLKIVDKAGNPVKDAQVAFQYTMNMQGMVPSKADATLSKEGFYETKANLGMKGEWEVTVMVRRSGQKEIQDKFKVAAQ